MKSIRKIFNFAILSFIIFLNVGVVYAVDNVVPGGTNVLIPPQVQAPTTVTAGGGVSCPTSAGKICNPIQAKTIDTLLASILSIVKFIAGMVLVIYFILAGLKYVTARGDEAQIKKAHEMLKWTAIGGAILLGAEVIQKLISGTITQLGVGL